MDIKKLRSQTIKVRASKPLNVSFSASGYGTKKYTFKNHEELMQDVEGTAAEQEGTVQDYGDELVVVGPDGEEVARWTII